MFFWPMHIASIQIHRNESMGTSLSRYPTESSQFLVIRRTSNFSGRRARDKYMSVLPKNKTEHCRCSLLDRRLQGYQDGQ